MRKIFLTIGFALYAANAFAITGFYKTIDDSTGNPRSIVALYTYEDLIGGRIVALFDEDGNISETILAPSRQARRVTGTPHIAGLDIIWGVHADDTTRRGGRIMDPQSGSIYRVTIREDGDTLRVRGSLGPIGRTQTWHVVSVGDLPAELQGLDKSGWVPVARD